MDRTARWFCGSLYVQDREHAEQEFRDRFSNTSGLLYAECSLEKGKSQEGIEDKGFHLQFRLEVKQSCRRSSLFKQWGKAKGDWFEPICCVRAQEAYVKKEDTHIAGPWEINNRETAAPGGKDQRTVSRVSHRPLEGIDDKGLMKVLLEEKWKEILMWTDFIDNGNVTLVGAEEQ